MFRFLLFSLLYLFCNSVFAQDHGLKFALRTGKSYTHRGKTYKNFEEFSHSPEYREIKLRVRSENETRRIQESQKVRVVELTPDLLLIKKWRSGHYPDMRNKEEDQITAKRMMGEWWWEKYQEPAIYNENSPSFKARIKVARRRGVTPVEAAEYYPDEVRKEIYLPEGSNRYQIKP
jgi:hypothetical protein